MNLNELEETKAKFNAALEKLAAEKALAVENLTREQFAEALRLALACGDFQRYVTVEGSRQQVVYTPFRDVEHWKGRALAAERALERIAGNEGEVNREEADRIAIEVLAKDWRK
jgi:hypothetical protein